MKSISVFEFESQNIRFVNGNPVAIDIAKVLGYASPKDAVKDLIDSDYLSEGELSAIRYGENNVRMQEIKVISNESGIYQLIFKSNCTNCEYFAEK
jgi:prophage antirepressor-like protein